MFTNNSTQCNDVIDLISSDDDDDRFDVPHYMNTESTQMNNIPTQNVANNLYSYNNQTEMPTLVSEPTVINVDKTRNTQSNRGKSAKKPCIPKKKTTTDIEPTCLINPNNSRSKTPVRHYVAGKFVRRLSFYQRVNCRLMSKVKQLTIRKQELQDIQIKYLNLKDKVLETEEKLLNNGIDTSEYPVFALANEEDKDTETMNDNKYDILLECKLDRENQKPNEGVPDYISTRERSPIIEPRIKNGINF